MFLTKLSVIRKIFSFIVVVTFILSPPSSITYGISGDTLRPAMGLRKSDLAAFDSMGGYGLAPIRLSDIKDAIESDAFLLETTSPQVIKRITGNPQKQGFVLNGLGLLVSYYIYLVQQYIPIYYSREAQRSTIDEVRDQIYKPMADSLDIISQRLQSGDLIPGSVRLRLSEKDNFSPCVEGLNRKARIAYLPMKGDPWQMGHLWVVWKLLADGYDIVVTMIDNSEPRKEKLTALPIREADSAWLYEAFSPFMQWTKFQKENLLLFRADGEIVLPSFIFSNREVTDEVIWTYIAGYDHFNWTVSKGDKGLLDVPSKLQFVLTELLGHGVNTRLNARFQKRADDSKDTKKQMKERVIIIEKLAEIDLIKFYADTIRQWLNETESSTKGYSAVFLGNVGIWIEEWQANAIEAIKERFSPKQRGIIEILVKEATEFSLGGEGGAWIERFHKASSWFRKDGSQTSVLDGLFRQLEMIYNKIKTFDPAGKEAKQLTDMLSVMVQERRMHFEVIEQPMNTSATKVRKGGEFHMTAPPFIYSAKALRYYPSVQTDRTNREDMEISANILADIIDLNLLCKQMTTITKEILEKHLGENLSPLVDLDILENRLKQRLEKGGNSSVLLGIGKNKPLLDSVKKRVRNKLAKAYGNALHAVDGYLTKFLVEDDMRALLLGSLTGTTAAKEKDAIRLIDEFRALVKDRTEEIVVESRKKMTLTISTVRRCRSRFHIDISS